MPTIGRWTTVCHSTTVGVEGMRIDLIRRRSVRNAASLRSVWCISI
ncbi:hypothetical protein P879_11678, partial [Paragonimus westermani]